MSKNPSDITAASALASVRDRLSARSDTVAPVLGALGGLALTGAALYAYAQYVEPYDLEWTNPRIVLPRLPKSLNGTRLLLLADPHTDRWTRRESDLLTMLRNQSQALPDLIVWGGDFLFHYCDTSAALQLVRDVAALFPGVPTYGILGNAEHKLRPEQTQKFIDDLTAAGVRILVNRWEPLTLRGEAITVAGVDDPYYGFDDLEAALEGAPDDRFRLLLAHSPQIVYRAARAGVDLMLSGHTHGGQIRFPIVGALKTQNTLGRKMDNGLFDADRLRPLLNGRDVSENFRLYVSRGIGVASLWRFHWLRPRFLCRPEVPLLELVSG